MTLLEWDQVGDRQFETGVSRGVLYPRDGDAVSWNGLTNVTEERSREVKSYYMDGIKYLDHHVPGSYSGKLQAFTYPDELDELTGIGRHSAGVFVHDQRASAFHLSYQTRVGNDVDGVDHGYRIHILYNLIAVPGTVTMDTIGESISPKPFEWNLTGTPDNMIGIRPTSHISIDSRYIDDELLADLEAKLYGRNPDPAVEDDFGENPNLPSAIELLDMLYVPESAPPT